jgi:hypothetical protein
MADGYLLLNMLVVATLRRLLHQNLAFSAGQNGQLRPECGKKDRLWLVPCLLFYIYLIIFFPEPKVVIER